MKPKTRDNLIYLAVGLTMAVLLAADFFYADSHGRKMWWPSRFASRSVYTTVLIWYAVLKGIRTPRQPIVQLFTCILFATLLHLTIVFTSRKLIEQLPGLAFYVLWVLELYFVFYATEKYALFLSRTRH